MNNEELTIRHLINSALLIPENDTISVMLKSHMLTQCHEMSAYKYKLPNNVFGYNVRCSNCCTAWDDGKFTSKIKKNKIGKSAKRRYKTIIKDKDRPSNEINAAKEKLHKKKVVINCSVCTKNTEIILRNKDDVKNNNKDIATPNAITKIIKNESIIKNTNKGIISKKKNQESFYQTMNNKPELTPNKNTPVKIENTPNRKKRNRDKFAGLCRDACNSSNIATPEPLKSNPLHLLLKGNSL